MSFRTRYLKADPMQDMAIHTGSFLDDSHLYSSHTEPAPVVLSLIQAWKRSLEFDDLSGLKTNNKKSFFFANNSVLRENISAAMQELPVEQQLSYKDSFVLVGSVVTSLGVPMKTNRDKRVLTTAQKLHKVRFAPVRFAYRARMAGAICKSAVFGTELVPLTQTLSETLRSSIVFLLWKGKSWCRSWAVTSTHIVPVHMLHPQAACFYHMFTLLARLLRRRDDICGIFRRFRAEPCEVTGYGPFSLVLQAMDTLGTTWTDTFQFVTLENTHIDFIDDHAEAFKHKLRECLRHYVLRTNAAFNKRHDMAGGPLLAYEANVTLLQQKGRGKKPPLTLFQQSHLRNILTGAVHTNQRLFQANCASTPVCLWCDSGQHEDHEHLFWQCQRWQHLRDSFVHKYTAVIPQLPPCTKLCGLLSCNLVANWPLSISPTQFIQELQIMFINILQERDSLKTKAPRSQRPAPNASDDHTHQPITPISQEQKLSKESLFPNYPWSYDTQHSFPNVCFSGKIPENWRLYRAGSKWLFGLGSFEPIHWYWSQLRWPEPSIDGPTITWLELALDFHCATHCPLAMPDATMETLTLGSMARYFAAATRRMAAICHNKFAPCQALQLAPVLTALGFNRGIGLQLRPKMLCPQFVHSCLFQTALSAENKNGIRFNVPPVLPPYAKPLWTPAAKKRLIGKQKVASNSGSQKPPRQVAAHKPQIASVSWSPEELSILDKH